MDVYKLINTLDYVQNSLRKAQQAANVLGNDYFSFNLERPDAPAMLKVYYPSAETMHSITLDYLLAVEDGLNELSQGLEKLRQELDAMDKGTDARMSPPDDEVSSLSDGKTETICRRIPD